MVEMRQLLAGEWTFEGGLNRSDPLQGTTGTRPVIHWAQVIQGACEKMSGHITMSIWVAPQERSSCPKEQDEGLLFLFPVPRKHSENETTFGGSKPESQSFETRRNTP